MRAMPKVELHAHLHGCIRDETLADLLRGEKTVEKGAADRVLGRPLGGPHGFKRGERTLSECFRVFDLIHRAVHTRAAVERVAREAVRDFWADGVVYLELRSTPRELDGGRVSRRGYVEAVARAAADEARRVSGGRMAVRLLLSVNRAGTPEEARRTVALAAASRALGVVGVELSGNPASSPRTFADFAGAFEEARAAGLGVSVHVGEVWNAADTRAVCLDFRPDRLGHAVLLEPEVRDALARRPIPIEVCPTSNVKTVAGLTYETHQFGRLFAAGYPLAVCTDDSGVFNVTLTHEYVALARAHSLSRAQLLDLAEGAADHVFERDPAALRGLRAAFAEARARSRL